MLLRLLRSLALGWILVATVVPAVVTVADARSEALASQVTPHVERAGGSDACPVAHAADCIACTLLRSGQLPADRALPVPHSTSDGESVAGVPARAGTPPEQLLALSRAPPSA